MKFFETFECSGQILSNFLCQFWNDELIPLQILYRSSVSWKITPLYFFSSKNIYFAQKEHIKMKIFETFKSSGQNPSNISCQFWNDKPIPLQILHHYSLSWHITPLWILSSCFFYFRLNDPIKKKSFLIGIHSMQGWTATMRHGVTPKRSTKKIIAYMKSF